MLTLSEFKSLKKSIEGKKVSAKDLLGILETKYLDKNPGKDKIGSVRNIKDSIHIIKTKSTDDLHKKEKQGGFKINNETRSAKADSVKKSL